VYTIIDGCQLGQDSPRLFPGVFLHGKEGISLQGDTIINRFSNFPDDLLLGWLTRHQPHHLVRLEGVTLPLYGDWSSNFFHWMYQALPQVMTARDSGYSGNYLVPAAPFVMETLELLGIDLKKVIPVENCDYYLECMCLFNKVSCGDPANLEALSRIREHFRARFVRAGADHRIYISRNGRPNNYRKVVNEAALEGLLTRFGFITLRLEELSFEEQLAYLCNCSALAGPHGAGMAHCNFMPERSFILELFPPNYVNPCVIPACKRYRHRYTQITSCCNYDPYPHGYDVAVHLDLVEMALHREFHPEEYARPAA